MIIAKQIPDEVLIAYMNCLLLSGEDGKEAIAAALNAWTGAYINVNWNGTESIHLPLPPEKEDR